MHGRYEDITKVDFALTEPSQVIEPCPALQLHIIN